MARQEEEEDAVDSEGQLLISFQISRLLYIMEVQFTNRVAGKGEIRSIQGKLVRGRFSSVDTKRDAYRKGK